MNNPFINNILLFIGLLFFQILIFNNINLFGYLNPYPYVAFVFLFPYRKERSALLILSFLLGLTLDFFSDSGGVHAASLLFTSYIRLKFVRLILRKFESEYFTFKLNTISNDKLIVFFFVLILIHHFTMFSLEYFDFYAFWTILKRAILSSIFTLLVVTFGYYLFVNKKK